jgi:S-phase kinase-associated protein 1
MAATTTTTPTPATTETTMDTAADGESKDDGKALKPEEKRWSLEADGAPEGKVVLETKDGKTFEVERAHCYISALIRTSLDGDRDEKSLPLKGVTSVPMGNVVKFMEHHKGNEPPIVEKPLRSKVMKEVCKDEWDATFIDAVGDNRQDLYDLILAANYLDIKSLLHLGCAKVASLIKGQPLEKIKEILTPSGATPSTATETGTGTEKKEEKRG